MREKTLSKHPQTPLKMTRSPPKKQKQHIKKIKPSLLIDLQGQKMGHMGKISCFSSFLPFVPAQEPNIETGRESEDMGKTWLFLVFLVFSYLSSYVFDNCDIFGDLEITRASQGAIAIATFASRGQKIRETYDVFGSVLLFLFLLNPFIGLVCQLDMSGTSKSSSKMVSKKSKKIIGF